MQEVIDKLKALRAELQDLENIYANASQPLPSTQQVLKTVKKCSNDIGEFSSLLDPSFMGVRGTIRQLKWSTQKERVKSFLSSIEWYVSLFAGAKANDTLQLADAAVSIGKHIAEGIDLERHRAAKERQAQEWRQLLNWLSPLDLQELGTIHAHNCQTRTIKGSSHWI
ncbi:hypothetical protein PV08_02345 [Exophiala spinifera]|uniref:Fungal N-terminal domain-containing protein n=1 Tax=Exophiala spinifera TaxID=91928 RepID=A0A0D2BGF9_9EURO|nr:uncharacterized protein PV08_02345 [Exophiala spinifera]KIW18058.1 hypothetical protein PV08_02345 [Exophiala spinifera]